MRLSVRARLVMMALALGVPPEAALGDMPALEFAAMCQAARWRRAS